MDMNKPDWKNPLQRDKNIPDMDNDHTGCKVKIDRDMTIKINRKTEFDWISTNHS